MAAEEGGPQEEGQRSGEECPGRAVVAAADGLGVVDVGVELLIRFRRACGGKRGGGGEHKVRL